MAIARDAEYQVARNWTTAPAHTAHAAPIKPYASKRMSRSPILIAPETIVIKDICCVFFAYIR